jgi:tetratricopeptide (TPR) repeat protein
MQTPSALTAFPFRVTPRHGRPGRCLATTLANSLANSAPPLLALFLAMPLFAAEAPKPCLDPGAARVLNAVQSLGFNVERGAPGTPVLMFQNHPFRRDQVVCALPLSKHITATSGGEAHWYLSGYVLPYDTLEATRHADYEVGYRKNFDVYWRAVDETCARYHQTHSELPLCQATQVSGGKAVLTTATMNPFPGLLLGARSQDAGASLECGGAIVQVSWRHYSDQAERDSQGAYVKALNDVERAKAYIKQRDAERGSRGMTELRTFLSELRRALDERKACDRPRPETAASAVYATEWVWIMSVHAARLDKLAADITEKYRAPLGIPAGRVIRVAEWLDEGGDIALGLQETPAELYDKAGNRKILPHSQALAAARADFGARRQALDNVLAESYRRWVEAVDKGDSAAIVALWQAADDLRRLRAALYGAGKTPLGGMLVDSAVKVLEAGIAQFFKQGPKYTDMVNVERLLGTGRGAKLIGLADDKAWEQLADKAEEVVKAQISGAFRQVIGAGDPKQIDNLADKLVRWADVMLDEVAYPRPRLADDYRQLGVNRFFNIGFSLNFLPEDELVARRFGQRTACMRKDVAPGRRIDICALAPLDAYKITALQRGESLVGYGGESPLTPGQYKEELSAANIVGFADWVRQLEETRRRGREQAATGEQLWFKRVQGGNPAQKLSALRLLATDLRRIMEDSFDRKVKKWGIETLSKRLVDATVPMLKPLGNFAQLGVTGAVDYFAPDNLARFVEDLDRASLETAKQIAAPPRIDLVLPNRDADLDRLMAVSASLPPSAVQAPAPPPSAAARAAKPDSFKEATVSAPAATGTKAQAVALTRQGVEFAANEKWPDAERAYRSALALDAGADDTWANLAEALGAQGKWPEAADALHRASQLMPRDPDYRRDLANALRKLGRHEEARREDAEADRLEK